MRQRSGDKVCETLFGFNSKLVRLDFQTRRKIQCIWLVSMSFNSKLVRLDFETVRTDCLTATSEDRFNSKVVRLDFETKSEAVKIMLDQMNRFNSKLVRLDFETEWDGGIYPSYRALKF